MPPLPAGIWDVAQRTAATLLRWRVDSAAALAALLAPVLEYDLASAQTLAETHGPKAIALAQHLIDWHRQRTTAASGQPDASPARDSALLRYLYCQAYLELPTFAVIPLVMAEHNVRLWSDKSAAASLAAETRAVFIPLAETLGMWRLRRWWVERSIDLQRANLLPAAPDAQAMQDAQDTQARQQRDAKDYEEILDRLVDQKQKKQAHFSLLREEILTRLQDALQEDRGATIHSDVPAGVRRTTLLPIVRRIKTYAGITWQRYRAGQSKDELINRLRIRILCASRLECYRVLGIVHGLGQPAALRSLGGLEDRIAAPKANGYQALQTTIVYQPSEKSHEEVLVEFRILTPAMHRLNERGALAALSPDPAYVLCTATEPWWHPKALARRAHRLHRYEGFGTRRSQSSWPSMT